MQMKISIPPDIRDWVAPAVAGGRYASESTYIEDLLNRGRDSAEKLACLQADEECRLRSAGARWAR